MIPPSFDPDEARRLLDGEADAADTFVIYVDTPQGYVFWTGEAVCVANGLPLSDQAREQIEEWLSECEDV
ncbi:MAG: hypothetical protein KGL39_25325 [Patescibacteria group bacterium]|nr:hypothetical protein [Patescibacteria group bacterium]